VEHTSLPAGALGHSRRVAVRAGNYQTAKMGRPFSAQLGAIVTDETGDGVPGVFVTFRISSGAASFGRGSRVGTVRTGSDGFAISAIVLAGERTGSVRVTASAALASHPAVYSLRVITGPRGRG
jgi:hypothetical protein